MVCSCKVAIDNTRSGRFEGLVFLGFGLLVFCFLEFIVWDGMGFCVARELVDRRRGWSLFGDLSRATECCKLAAISPRASVEEGSMECSNR